MAESCLAFQRSQRSTVVGEAIRRHAVFRVLVRQCGELLSIGGLFKSCVHITRPTGPSPEKGGPLGEYKALGNAGETNPPPQSSASQASDGIETALGHISAFNNDTSIYEEQPALRWVREVFPNRGNCIERVDIRKTGVVSDWPDTTTTWNLSATCLQVRG